MSLFAKPTSPSLLNAWLGMSKSGAIAVIDCLRVPVFECMRNCLLEKIIFVHIPVQTTTGHSRSPILSVRRVLRNRTSNPELMRTQNPHPVRGPTGMTFPCLSRSVNLPPRIVYCWSCFERFSAADLALFSFLTYHHLPVKLSGRHLLLDHPATIVRTATRIPHTQHSDLPTACKKRGP